MPTKPSGETKSHVVKQRRKNGDIYVYSRTVLYDPVKKNNKILGSTLLYKIPKGETNPVPTRPKRQTLQENPNSASGEQPLGSIRARRIKIGMMQIIDYLGKVSGIDNAIYNITDVGTAQKIISLARYFFATNGDTLTNLAQWQPLHLLPYQGRISEDVYHDLFMHVGTDEALQQNFFYRRCNGLKDRAVLAYDSTTISTYSEQIQAAQYGHNKAGDHLKTVKLSVIYSVETGQPLIFSTQRGDIADVTTIENALKQLAVFGLGHAEVVVDNGYYSEKNLSELCSAHFDFIVRVDTGISWVRDELDKHLQDLKKHSSACTFDVSTHGVTALMMRELPKERKYDNHKRGIPKGNIEKIRRRLYLHMYVNTVVKTEDDISFDKQLIEIQRRLESGVSVDGLTMTEQELVSDYMTVKRYAGKVNATINDERTERDTRFNGHFTLISNNEKDTFKCLYKYRRRNMIESFFRSDKQHVDGTRTRVWSDECLKGRLFVQFVALCYYEFFSQMIRNVVSELGKKNGNRKHDLKANLDLENKLATWLKNSSVHQILNWFDTIEKVQVVTDKTAKSWVTESTKRDRLFLEKMGISKL